MWFRENCISPALYSSDSHNMLYFDDKKHLGTNMKYHCCWLHYKETVLKWIHQSFHQYLAKLKKKHSQLVKSRGCLRHFGAWSCDQNTKCCELLWYILLTTWTGSCRRNMLTRYDTCISVLSLDTILLHLTLCNQTELTKFHGLEFVYLFTFVFPVLLHVFGDSVCIVLLAFWTWKSYV